MHAAARRPIPARHNHEQRLSPWVRTGRARLSMHACDNEARLHRAPSDTDEHWACMRSQAHRGSGDAVRKAAPVELHLWTSVVVLPDDAAHPRELLGDFVHRAVLRKACHVHRRRRRRLRRRRSRARRTRPPARSGLGPVLSPGRRRGRRGAAAAAVPGSHRLQSPYP